ncbi:MAG: hypothetical protein HYX79_10640 [Chloroflexi bacterium]|nr:hypothetical protein [Chloroflexota bacterium]
MITSKWDEVVGLSAEARLKFDMVISHLDTAILELNNTIYQLECSLECIRENDSVAGWW